MVSFQEVYKGHWDGELMKPEDLKRIRPELLDDRSLLLYFVDHFKLGDFSKKPGLIALMNQTKDTELQCACVRVFASVCSHEDFRQPENFEFLEIAEEEVVYCFAAVSITMLSYEVVPYLFVLFEEWEDTNIEESIRNALDYIISYTDELDYDVAMEEIQDYAYSFLSEADPDLYYFYGKPFFPGILTQQMTNYAQRRLKEQLPLGITIQPDLLSLCSGKCCPMTFSTVVNESSIRDLYAYIKDLIEMDWKPGNKYYYGHSISGS